MPARGKISWAVRYRESDAIILHNQADLIRIKVYSQGRMCRLRVAQDIAQGFLCNPVEGQLYLTGQTLLFAGFLKSDFQRIRFARLPCQHLQSGNQPEVFQVNGAQGARHAPNIRDRPLGQIFQLVQRL